MAFLVIPIPLVTISLKVLPHTLTTSHPTPTAEVGTYYYNSISQYGLSVATNTYFTTLS